MLVGVTPSQSNIQEALRAFLVGILPSGTEVFIGQGNRVPEPHATDFVVMTPIRRNRLSTNKDGAADALFTGAFAGTTLTVASVAIGALKVGSPVFGVGIAPNTQIVALGTGTGAAGTYTVMPTQTVTSRQMAAGTTEAMQSTEVTVQLDVHGPQSADNAQRISTLMRDSYGVERFQASGYAVAPLHADEPRQVPFINAEQQYETRWVIDACLQADQTVTIPQEYADALDFDLESVEAAHPA